jgi:hypothetical protein
MKKKILSNKIIKDGRAWCHHERYVLRSWRKNLTNEPVESIALIRKPESEQTTPVATMVEWAANRMVSTQKGA